MKADEAAVEAMKQIMAECLLGVAPACFVLDAPRIITNAYKEQHRRHPVPYESERDMLQDAVNRQEEQLDVESEVREELVVIAKRTTCWCPSLSKPQICPRCKALTAAKELSR